MFLGSPVSRFIHFIAFVNHAFHSIPPVMKKFQTNQKNTTPFYEEYENCPELPEYIRRDIQKKRKLRKFWQRTRCPKVKTELNTLTAKIKESVRDWRGMKWHVMQFKPLLACMPDSDFPSNCLLYKLSQCRYGQFKFWVAITSTGFLLGL